MKFIFKLLGIITSIGLAVLLLALLINDTFLKDKFLIDGMLGSGMSIPRLSYLVDRYPNNDEFHFYSILPLNKLQEVKNDYLKKLTNCYGIYYYDQDNNITITKYTFNNYSIFKEMIIGLDYTNYCDEKYILDDTWLEDYKLTSKINDLNISKNNFQNLMGTLSNATRNINPIINPNYHSQASITYNFLQKNFHYYMEIKDASANEILVIKTVNEEKSFAVYKLDNALEYLKSLL